MRNISTRKKHHTPKPGVILLKLNNVKKSKLMYNDNKSNKILCIDNVDAFIDYLFQECENVIEKSSSSMTKYDKFNAVKFLKYRGLFSIITVESKVCKFLNISKFSLYNYLNAINNNDEII